MPIRPEYRWLYPIDWVQLSASSVPRGGARDAADRTGGSFATWATAAGGIQKSRSGEMGRGGDYEVH